jgi:GNAT superfamily N-acetyltransferase
MPTADSQYLPRGVTIDPVTPIDIPLALEFIHGLADYEHEPDAVKTTPQLLHQALFGDRPAAEAVIARIDSVPAGFTLWFRETYSTWTGLPGLWLEDLFVKPDLRRNGVGKALLVYLARLCVERGYGRLEWSVLDWNTPIYDPYRSLAPSPWTNGRSTASPGKPCAGSPAPLATPGWSKAQLCPGVCRRFQACMCPAVASVLSCSGPLKPALSYGLKSLQLRVIR